MAAEPIIVVRENGLEIDVTIEGESGGVVDVDDADPSRVVITWPEANYLDDGRDFRTVKRGQASQELRRTRARKREPGDERAFHWGRILEIFVGVFAALTLWALLGLIGAGF